MEQVEILGIFQIHETVVEIKNKRNSQKMSPVVVSVQAEDFAGPFLRPSSFHNYKRPWLHIKGLYFYMRYVVMDENGEANIHGY